VSPGAYATDDAYDAGGVELGSLKQAAIAADVLDCESGSAEARALCGVVLARINAELDAAGVTIDKDGLLFTYDDPTDQKIPTGHSCTVTADVKHRRASARIGSSASLDFSGNSFTRPLALKLRVPVSVDARVDIKQSFGNRALFGSCNDHASDSYSLVGDASTTAELLVGFALNPSFGVQSDGDFVITLEPEVAVGAALANLDIGFRVSGVSPITPALTFISGFGSTLARSTTALFTGDSVSNIVKSTAAWDFGMPVILGVGALPRPMEDAIFGLVSRSVERRAEQGAAKFQADLERRLKSQVARALKLDGTGKRVITVRQEFMELLDRLGAGADVFVTPPVDPSISCFDGANGLCRACQGCSACLTAQSRCRELRAAFESAHRPVITTPVSPTYRPEPPPAPTPAPAFSLTACTQGIPNAIATAESRCGAGRITISPPTSAGCVVIRCAP